MPPKQLRKFHELPDDEKELILSDAGYRFPQSCMVMDVEIPKFAVIAFSEAGAVSSGSSAGNLSGMELISALRAFADYLEERKKTSDAAKAASAGTVQ